MNFYARLFERVGEGQHTKFDDLHKLREHLNAIYTKNTSDKYYFAVKGLFDGLHWEQLANVTAEEIQQRMLMLKTNRDFSAAKCGLLELQNCCSGLQLPEDGFFTQTSSHKRNYKKRKFETLELDTVKRKINSLPDKKLKLAYRLMLASGARASEAAALKPEDILIDDESMSINIINGKGGKDRTVAAIKDEYLKNELKVLIESSATGEPLFYSASHMENEASAYGFECHDLRRVFAKKYLKQCKESAPDAYTANGQLMAAMGHSKWRTTKIYLRRKINY